MLVDSDADTIGHVDELAVARDHLRVLERRVDELGAALDSAADDLEGD